jgi:cell division septum initiation protein DivIVA
MVFHAGCEGGRDYFQGRSGGEKNMVALATIFAHMVAKATSLRKRWMERSRARQKMRQFSEKNLAGYSNRGEDFRARYSVVAKAPHG